MKEWKDRIVKNREEAADGIDKLRTDRRKKAKIDEAVDKLKGWRKLRSNIESALLYGKRKEVEKQLGKKAETVIHQANEAIPVWEETTFGILDKHNPDMIPFLDHLYYLYDFGDDWCIKITCEKRYTRKNEWDFPDEHGRIRISTFDEKDGLRTFRYFDEDGIEVTEDERVILSEVDVRKAPLCIASDGVFLVEDPGGIYGFYEMLKTLAGDDPEEKKSMREWARGLGWTGRISKPENML